MPVGPRTRQTLRSRVVGIAVSLAAIVVTLLIVEAVLRFTHAFGAHVSWCEPDPSIGYRFTPGREYWSLQENDHPISGRINSLGWRDRERSLEPPGGAYRVAVLGDSFVEAFQVESDSTFVALAESDLTARLGTPVEVLNFGRSGATQSEEFLVLQSDVMGLSPDLVAVLFNPENDIGDVSRSTADPMRPFYELSANGELKLDTSFHSGRGYRMRLPINGLKQRSALLSLLTERYNLFVRTRHAKALAAPEGTLPRHLTLCTSRPDSAYEKNYRLNKVLIRKMAEYCGQRGVRFLLVCGDIACGPGEIERIESIDPTFDPRFFEADLAALADSLEIDYLGLQTPFMEYVRAGGGRLRWDHYNYTGHRVVARVLSDRLAGIILDDRRDSADRASAGAAGEPGAPQAAEPQEDSGGETRRRRS